MAEEKFGLGDDDLAVRRTVYAPDALKDMVMLISGGAGGLGRATAWLYARLGAKVIVVGRSQEKLDSLTTAMAGKGFNAASYAVDIKDPVAINAMFDRVWAEHGGIDSLVNSAGGQFPQLAIDFSVKGWNAVINTNLNGTWYMMQSAAQHWRDSKRPGSIINIVVVVTHGLYGLAHSVAARSGVISLSRALSVEWAPLKVRVNCIAPGTIETEGWKVYTPETRASYPNTNPMKRVGNAWDIAEACAYLSAESGNFITGEVLTLDGGGQHWGEIWTTAKPDYFKVGDT